MKFENTAVFNFEGALRGMRNPKNSWHLNDSYFGMCSYDEEKDYEIADYWVKKDFPNWPEEWSSEANALHDKYDKWLLSNGILEKNDNINCANCAFLGPNDMKLAKSLIKAGNEHRKFLRQIIVSVDITAPLYWWKEADQYKISTTTNSCSTMHKIASEPITLNSFEITDYSPDLLLYDKEPYDIDTIIGDEVECIINMCETLRKRYLETKDVRYWKELIRWLPEGWLQKRTWTGSYETVRSMYHQRDHHKLHPEWVDGFCGWVEKDLPYAKDLIIE